MIMNAEDVLQYIASYNERIYPLQYLAYFLGLVAVILVFIKPGFASRWVSGILALMWLWIASAFALPYALEGNFVGITTAVIFFIQGVLFAWGVFKPKLFFRTQSKTYAALAILFIFIALVGYPVVGYLVGHIYPRTLTFGLTPCPTTVFTLGIMMLTTKKVPVWLLFLPFLFSLTGVFPVIMGLYEDIGLLLSGLVCGPLIYFKDRRKR